MPARWLVRIRSSRRSSRSRFVGVFWITPAQSSPAVRTRVSAIASHSAAPVRCARLRLCFACVKAHATSGCRARENPSMRSMPSQSALSPSSSRSASQRAPGAFSGRTAETAGIKSFKACSIGSAYRTGLHKAQQHPEQRPSSAPSRAPRAAFGWGSRVLEQPWHGFSRVTYATARINSRSPCPARAQAGTTGTPKRASSRARSTEVPRCRASSIKLTQTTTRSVISIVWSARSRLRSRQDASHTTTTASAPPKQIKSRAACSSAECAISE